MSYRNELEAAHARAAALERDLADARREVERLKGGVSDALVLQRDKALTRGAAVTPAAQRWLGAPSVLELEKTLEGELPESAYTELVERIREVLANVGTVSILPGSLAWNASVPNHNAAGPIVSVHVRVRDGKTNIRIVEKLGNLAGTIFGGIGGGVGLGGIMAPIATAWISPLLVAVALPMWLGTFYGACRGSYRRAVRRRAARLEQLLGDLVGIASQHIERASAD